MSWSKKRIKDLAIKVTKGTTPTTYGMSFTESGINYIKAGALNGFSSLLNDGFTFIDERTHEKLSRSQLEENDVLVTIAGANVGSTGYVESKYLPANTNQAVGIIRLNEEKVNPKFVYYHFKKPSTKRYCLSVGGQSAQPNVNLTVLKSFELDIPNRLTQDRIVSVLSAYDKLIQNNKRRIELLEKSARLLYKEWFIQLRFPGHEHTKIVDGVPEWWEKKKVEDLGDIVTGKTPSTKNESYYGGDIPFIKTPDMHGNLVVTSTELNLTEAGANTQKNKYLPKHSILVSCIGSVGVVSLNDKIAHTNQQINAIIPKKDSHRYWILFFAKELKPVLEAIGGGATMNNVNKTKFSSIDCIVPPASLIEMFNDYAEKIVEQIEKLTVQNQSLSRARDLLLPKLMNGDIPV